MTLPANNTEYPDNTTGQHFNAQNITTSSLNIFNGKQNEVKFK